jgi:hypothetical protein
MPARGMGAFKVAFTHASIELQPYPLSVYANMELKGTGSPFFISILAESEGHSRARVLRHDGSRGEGSRLMSVAQARDTVHPPR